MNNHNSEVINELKKASEGLLFMSESEFPFEVFLWESLPTITPEKLQQLTNHSTNDPIEVVGLDEFFAVATTEQDWYEAEEKAIVKKYQRLIEVIKKNLQDLKVYRIGKRSIDVYILGRIDSNTWAGLSTKVVET